MYEFVSGPLVWIAFIIFIGGSLYRIYYMLSNSKKETVVFPHMSLEHSLASLVHWVIPFNNQYMRKRPIFTIVSFAFHICLVFTPIFLLAHVILLDESWNISWWSLPEGVADWMTIIVIAGCIFFLYRRLTDPVVKNVTDGSDYLLLAITALPFITGFIAYHQLFAYKTILIVHILAGEIMLIAIPFTRLSHMLFFVFTRAYFGSEQGHVKHSKDW
ncbi:MAG: nitrate reductase [Desulfobacterales bacterium]|uniref:Nitrate reductase n=1 Tax=Candidatus Desulfaltia bathyphila TaxID=2841697 RepID=A0A8J6N4P7_9BACT|nr:nitrate reductase [Candidatus Desulfaltia bathyphila]MBL7195865.1 nitrate reductase [Desulfobacterales bacterium]MBL7207363.1 nitrate reductase [Desulfobacterales bacterium]